MSPSNDPTIQGILDQATQLTREQRELQIMMEIEKYGAQSEFEAILDGVLGHRRLEDISGDDFNHAALVSWKFIYSLRQSRTGTVH